MLLKEGKFDIAEAWDHVDYFINGRYGEYKKFSEIRFNENEVKAIIKRFENENTIAKVTIDSKRMGVAIEQGNIVRYFGCVAYREAIKNDSELLPFFDLLEEIAMNKVRKEMLVA
jgi:hypothetical protein